MDSISQTLSVFFMTQCPQAVWLFPIGPLRHDRIYNGRNVDLLYRVYYAGRNILKGGDNGFCRTPDKTPIAFTDEQVTHLGRAYEGVILAHDRGDFRGKFDEAEIECFRRLPEYMRAIASHYQQKSDILSTQKNEAEQKVSAALDEFNMVLSAGNFDVLLDYFPNFPRLPKYSSPNAHPIEHVGNTHSWLRLRAAKDLKAEIKEMKLTNVHPSNASEYGVFGKPMIPNTDTSQIRYLSDDINRNQSRANCITDFCQQLDDIFNPPVAPPVALPPPRPQASVISLDQMRRKLRR